MKFLGAFKTVALLASKHKSAILSGVAVGSAVCTVVATVRATIKATKDVEKYEEIRVGENDDAETTEDNDRLKISEVLKISWKHYIPVVIGTTMTVTCIICAHRVDAKRIAAATSALLLSEKMNKELEDKTIEEFGKDKLNEFKAAIFKENSDLDKAYRVDKKALHREVMKHDISNVGYYMPNTHDRMCWFKEDFTGRFVWASKNQIERAINMAIRDAYRNGSRVISLNDLYDYMDLDQIPDGYSFGWDLESGRDLDVVYEPDITDNGEPCLVMHYHSRPVLI